MLQVANLLVEFETEPAMLLTLAYTSLKLLREGEAPAEPLPNHDGYWAVPTITPARVSAKIRAVPGKYEF
jgi:hypothetical protein